MTHISYQLLERIMSNDDKEFYKELGQRVAELRKLNHITQVQMAQKLSVSQQQIAAFETGKVKIPISALPKLSAILSTPIDQILGIEKKGRRGPASKLQQQIEMVALLPRSKQKFVIEMLDTLILQSKMTG